MAKKKREPLTDSSSDARTEYLGELLTPQQIVFLRSFEQLRRLKLAVDATGTGRTVHYRWVDTDPAYRAAYNIAKQNIIDELFAAAMDRGTDGWDEPVFHLGEQTAVKRRYSDTLLMFSLKRLDPKFRDSYQQVNVSVAPVVAQQSVQDALAAAKSDPEYIEFLRQKTVADAETAGEFSDLLA